MNPFQVVAGRRTKLSKFDRTHEKKLSMNMADLIPIVTEEIIPGDRFRINSEVLLRFSPLVAPLMHRVDVYTHYFFVPNRIVWNNWESFITGGKQGDEMPAVPQLNMSDAYKAFFAKKRLPDYMGLPIIDPDTTVTNDHKISALPFRAYAEIFNEYYQDQNLGTGIGYSKGDGIHNQTETQNLTTLRKRAWEKDYFTSALPWAQRGGESILPADVTYKDPAPVLAGGANPPDGSPVTTQGGFLNAGGSLPLSLDNIESLGLTVNDLRKSVRLQEWLERTARGGSRYIEQILSHFGVRSSDARLQRPEYLGGGKNPVVISEVLQTSATNTQDTAVDASVQANMAGHGISVGANNGFSKKFEEHGYVIGIMSVLPKTAYQQGIDRHWQREDKFDYYWPEFAQLGEQEVKNKELWTDFTDVTGDETFGYQSRYAEYKYAQSKVCADFRDDLSFYHLGRQFDEKPELNNSFVTADPDPRIFAITDPDEDKLYCQVLNRIDALRPMPFFNKPTL